MSVFNCPDCQDTGEYRHDTEKFDRLCNCSLGQELHESRAEYDANERARYKEIMDYADDNMAPDDDGYNPNEVHTFYRDDRPRQFWMTDIVWAHIEKERAR